jgi:transcriptional regulator with XRE-family HTH domain
MVLLRRVIGDALRARRQAQHRTLREVSSAANVSLGYLSEIERGQKEASSELLAAICEALGAALSEVLRDVSDSLALGEDSLPLVDGLPREGLPRVLVPAGVGERSAGGEPAPGGSMPGAPGSAASGPAIPSPAVPSGVPAASEPKVGADAKASIAEGKMSMAVHRDGPLKTTLRATRTARERDIVYAA